jgi:replicative DNA helicase
MLDSGLPVDVVTVAESLERIGKLDTVGGLAYLAEVAQSALNPNNVGRHASIVKQAAIRRALMSALQAISEAAQQGEISDVLSDAQARIMAIGERSESRQPSRVVDIARDRLNVLDERFNGNDDGLSTGLIDLDEKLGKIRPGDLMVIAGRPGMGKSAFAMQLAATMANDAKPALFFSLEMSAGQLVDRIMSSAGKVNLKKFRSASFDENDWHGLTVAVGQAQSMPVFIDDHSLSLSEILATMRAFKRRHGGIGPVVIDYVGLVQSSGDTREQEISKITRSLKLAAKQLGCPILALSQLNRKLEDRGDKRPLQSDLRESGAIEQDADSILMLYRDEMYDQNSDHKGVCEVLIRKNRHGETGMVPTVFRAELVRFESFSGDYTTAAHKPYKRNTRDDL